MKKPTKFSYPVTLVSLKVLNTERESFRESIVNIPYLLYEVESLSDGRKIVINKPGGKRNFGRLAKDDFMVYICNPTSNELWLISHQELYEDLECKAKVSADDAVNIIDGLLMVCNGKEPEEVLNQLNPVNPCGLQPELIYKVYKWVWGQEDCNYPTKQGRWLSMNNILEIRQRLILN